MTPDDARPDRRSRPLVHRFPVRGCAATLAALLSVAASLLISGTPASAASQPDVLGNSVLSHAQVQARQWWIVRLNLHKAWKITRGKGVTVAVMDTGVDRKFGDLRGALVPGFGVDTHATGDTDEHYHGTRMADDIAGRGTGFGLLGVAPQAKVLPVTVPSDTDSDAVALALQHLTAMSDPPQIVNMSFGGPFPCPGAVAAATRAAAQAGIILVAAAGNTAQEGNLSQYPADCPGVVGVGAVKNNTEVWSQSQRRPYVMLTGPGVHIVGFDALDKYGYGYGDGTSDASAIVSGIAALVLAHSPSMSARDVVTRLLATTHQFSGKQGTRNNRYGYGVALPYNALTEHVPAGSPNPVYAKLSPAGAPSSGPTSSAPTSDSSSASSPRSGSTPTGGTPSAASPGATSPSDPAAATSSSSGTGIGLIVGIVVVVIVIIGIVLAVTLRARRRAVGAPGGSTGYGPPPPGGGYGPPPPGGGYGPPPGGGGP